MSATAPVPPTERLAAIIAWLAARVAEQGNRKRLAGPLVVAIWTRLHRIAARFRAVAATPLPPPRPARTKPEAPAATQDPESPPLTARAPRRPPSMPCGARWLLHLIPGAALSLSQIEDLLQDPQMQALLAADPRLGHILRALCWMLGVRRDLAPPPRRRRKPRAPTQRPAKPAPRKTAASRFAASGVLASLAAPRLAPPPAGRAPPVGLNLRARDLLTQLRMGPSPIWD